MLKGLFCVIGASVILALVQKKSILPPDWMSAVTIAANGVLFFIAYKLLMCGISSLGATTTAFTSMAEPITSLIVSSILYPADKITALNFLGVTMILGAMMLVSIRRLN